MKIKKGGEGASPSAAQSQGGRTFSAGDGVRGTVLGKNPRLEEDAADNATDADGNDMPSAVARGPQRKKKVPSPAAAMAGETTAAAAGNIKDGRAGGQVLPKIRITFNAIGGPKIAPPKNEAGRRRRRQPHQQEPEPSPASIPPSSSPTAGDPPTSRSGGRKPTIKIAPLRITTSTARSSRRRQADEEEDDDKQKEEEDDEDEEEQDGDEWTPRDAAAPASGGISNASGRGSRRSTRGSQGIGGSGAGVVILPPRRGRSTPSTRSAGVKDAEGAGAKWMGGRDGYDRGQTRDGTHEDEDVEREPGWGEREEIPPEVVARNQLIKQVRAVPDPWYP